MTSKLRVLHVLNHSVPHSDGYCVRSENIVRFLRDDGIDIAVVTSPRHEPVPTGEVELIDHIRYHRSFGEPARRIPLLNEWLLIRRMTKRIVDVARMEGSQLLHCHSPCRWGLAAVRAGRQLGVPVVYEIRGFWEDSAVDQGNLRSNSMKYRLSRRLETRVAKDVDCVVTIAQAMRDELVERGIDVKKIALSPNGVDLSSFVGLPQLPDEPSSDSANLTGKISFGYVGSLYAWEGVDDFLRATSIILQRIPKAEFVVAGGGPMEAVWRKLADEQPNRQRIRMLGKIPHDEIPELYSSLDVLVYPRKSNRTTELVTPLKPLEAMAMGKAVIGSDVGGIREIIVDGTGLLYRAGDIHDLAAKCIQLAQDSGLRQQLTQRARQYVSEQRDWRVLVQRYLEIYERLVPGRSRKGPLEYTGSTEPAVSTGVHQ